MDICITCINKHANNSIKICIDEENNNRNDILYQNYVKERQIKYSRHEHYLQKCKFNNLTNCNICNKAYLNGNYFGHCSLCYFNCCEECLSNESWIRKSPFHNHLLILCNTNRLFG